ncbi:hypothetical protein [Maridesulfovibrio frigidus]|uniref:hypothetical protein n=1 Tax=Maridesulfovibrio frigidus TaxID=340956 RepID=UPI0004E18B62|nr:hypothetical protein [Maridesulfovibrio frigidus]
MKKLLIILVFVLITGCGLKNNKGPSQQDTSKISSDEIVDYEFDLDRKKIWLDEFLETSMAIRSVTQNLYLHNQTDYRDSMAIQSDIVFDKLLFSNEAYEEVVQNQTQGLRDQLIKALLMVVQIQIDTAGPAAETESAQNKKARANLEQLDDLAGKRVDLDITGLGLECGELQKCISEFETITDNRK